MTNEHPDHLREIARGSSDLPDEPTARDRAPAPHLSRASAMNRPQRPREMRWIVACFLPVMTITWALVADRSEARILENRGPGKGLTVVEDIHHPEGNLQDKDVKSDKPGRSFDKGGMGRHAMEPHELPHEHIAHVFAKFLAEKLRHARVEHRFERLVLAAEPTFLGRLRAELDEPTRKLVSGEVPKHLLGEGDHHLTEALGKVMNV